jgi:hypothetical protein
MEAQGLVTDSERVTMFEQNLLDESIADGLVAILNAKFLLAMLIGNA